MSMGSSRPCRSSARQADTIRFSAPARTTTVVAGVTRGARLTRTPGTSSIRSHVLATFNRYGIVAHAESLDYNLATLDFRVHGLSLTARERSDRPFLDADLIRIDGRRSGAHGPSIFWPSIAFTSRSFARRTDRRTSPHVQSRSPKQPQRLAISLGSMSSESTSVVSRRAFRIAHPTAQLKRPLSTAVF